MFDKLHLYDMHITVYDQEDSFQDLIAALKDMGNRVESIQNLQQIQEENELFTADIILINHDINTKKDLQSIDTICTNSQESAVVLLTIAKEKAFYEKLLKLLNLHIVAKPMGINHMLELLGNIAKMKKITTSLSIESQFNSVSDIIRNIAHQWRQPLNRLSGIVMNLYAASEFDKLDKTMLYEKLDGAEKTLKYLSQTIEDFKNIYISNKMKEYFLLSEVVTEAMQMSSSYLEGYIQTRIKAKKACSIYGYKKELFQALINIFQNSKEQFKIKGTKKPMITVELDADDKKCSIKIEDNGGGIELEPIEQIFHPYKTTKKNDGTGIGLYMSKLIIEQKMGGTIKASNSDTGAVFEITLYKPAFQG